MPTIAVDKKGAKFSSCDFLVRMMFEDRKILLTSAAVVRYDLAPELHLAWCAIQTICSLKHLWWK